MRTARIFWICILLFFLATHAWAIKVDSLYTGTVPVTTQAVPEREQATQPALEQVLVKVSGNDQVINNPKLKSRLSSANTLVQAFSYLSTPQSNSKTPYVVAIQFDPSGVKQWLNEAGAAIWGKNRPLILTWVVYEAPGHPPEIIGSDSITDIATLLKQNAEVRGLPIMLPLMDMTDINLVSVRDITDMSIQKLMAASKRYNGDGILIGHITQGDASLTSQWKLAVGDNQWGWDVSGKNMAEITSNLVNDVTSTLATRFAVVTSDNNAQKDIAIKVTGITHYSDFNRLTQYLSHLTPVANVEITKILSDNDVILKVSLRGSPESFTTALSLGKKLTPAPSTNTTDTMVVYQWNP